jgi:hypothetical protein
MGAYLTVLTLANVTLLALESWPASWSYTGAMALLDVLPSL